MAIKDMQTLYDEGYVAGPFDGSELVLIEQDGLSKVARLDNLAVYFQQYFEQNSSCCGGACTPTSVQVEGDGLIYTGYSEADVMVATFTYDTFIDRVVYFPSAERKYQLLVNLAEAINTDVGYPIIHTQYTGGGSYSFDVENIPDATGDLMSSTLTGYDNSETANAALLTLKRTISPDPVNDAVVKLFGEAIVDVTVASCGSKYYQPV
jgi:hypothetical protein